MEFYRPFFISVFLISVPAGAGSGSYLLYRVKPGDTLSAISARFHVSESNLARLNQMDDPGHLVAGKRIRIKAAAGIREESLTDHFVRGNIRLSRPVSGRVPLETGFRLYGDDRNYGLKYRIRKPSAIYSSQDGRVIKISRLRGYGRYILIDHGQGWITMYSNLSEISVKKGQSVKNRNILGKVRDGKFLFLLSYKGKPVNPVGYL